MTSDLRESTVPAGPRRRLGAGAFLLGALASVACERRGTSVPQYQMATEAASPSAAQADSALRFPFLPDSARTPGATLEVTAADICVPGYSKRVRNVPIAVKRQVYASYGIRTHEPGEYEIDHLISLELGGSNSLRNLWPQSFRTHPWNAHVKDALENELHRRVCVGTIDLAIAQRAIASNWIIGYRTYVRPTPPPTSHARKHVRPRQRRRSLPAVP